MSVYVKSSSLHEGSVRNVVNHAEDYLTALFPNSGIESVRACGEHLPEEWRGVLPVEQPLVGQVQYVMVSAGMGQSEGQMIRAGVMVHTNSVDAVFRPLLTIKYFGSFSECSKLARLLQDELEGIYLIHEKSSLAPMYKKMLDERRQVAVRGYVNLSLDDEGLVRVCEESTGRLLDECRFEGRGERLSALSYLSDWALLIGRHDGMAAVADGELAKEIMDNGRSWAKRFLDQSICVADESQVDRVVCVQAMFSSLGYVVIAALNLKGQCVAYFPALDGEGSLQEQMNLALLYDGYVGEMGGLSSRGSVAQELYDEEIRHGCIHVAGLSKNGSFWFEADKMPQRQKHLLEGCVEVDVTHPAERQR